MTGSRILEWLAVGTAFLMPLAFWPGSQQPFSTAKDWLLGAWVLAGFALAVAAGLTKRRLPPRALAAATVWVLALSLSAGTGDDVSIRELIRNLLACAGFLLMQWSGARVQKVVLALVSGGTIAAAVAVLQWIGADPFLLFNLEGSLQGSSRIRIFSTMGNPNFVAALLTAILPLAFCAPSPGNASPRTWQWLKAGVVLVQAGAILAAGSRAPVLGLAAAGFWLLFSRTRLKPAWFFLGLALCAILILFSPARPLGKTIAGRIYIWRIALAHAGQIPLTGYGPGAFALRFAQWETDYIRANPGNPELAFSGFQDHAHNDYVEFLVDYGILGLCAFIVTVGLAAPLSRGRSQPLPGQGIAASIVALLAIAAVDFPLHRPAELFLFWTQLALLWMLADQEASLPGH